MKKTLLLCVAFASALCFSAAHAVEPTVSDPCAVPVQTEPRLIATLDGKTIKMENRAERQLAVRAVETSAGRIALVAAEPLPYRLSGVQVRDHDALAEALKQNVTAEKACRNGPQTVPS